MTILMMLAVVLWGVPAALLLTVGAAALLSRRVREDVREFLFGPRTDSPGSARSAEAIRVDR